MLLISTYHSVFHEGKKLPSRYLLLSGDLSINREATIITPSEMYLVGVYSAIFRDRYHFLGGGLSPFRVRLYHNL